MARQRKALLDVMVRCLALFPWVRGQPQRRMMLLRRGSLEFDAELLKSFLNPVLLRF